MAFIVKLRSYFNDLIVLYKNWNWSTLYHLKLNPLFVHYIRNRGCGDRLDLEYHALVQFLYKENLELINKYKKITSLNETLEANSTIWVCWWQGEAQMPELVAKCFELLKRYKGMHPIRLITKDNYHRYISFPERIMELFEKGTISMAHFSDIMRMYLISRHGGFWIDATYWVTKPIDISSVTFFTVKSGNNHDPFIPRGRWAANFLGGCMGAKYYSFMYDALIDYWNQHDCIINYFLIDYFTQLAYEQFDDIRRQIDEGARLCPQLTSLNMNLEVDVKYMEKIVANNDFIKLSWKWKLQKETEDRHPTIYAYFLSF